MNAIVEVNNDLWLATDYGIVIYNKTQNSFSRKNIDISAASREVKNIYKDENKLWISIYAGGLHVYNLNTQRIDYNIPGFEYGYVKAMTKDNDGNYWIAAGTNDPFLKLNAKTLEWEKSFDIKNSKTKFAPVNVQDVFADDNSNIWIGTRSDGLYIYNYKTKQNNSSILWLRQTRGHWQATM